MSADGSVTIEWGGEEHRFRLAIGEMRELFEAINRPRLAIGAPMLGPMSLLTNLQKGDAWPAEVREVIRLGLIGGGMKNDRALVLIKRFVEPPGQLLSASVVAVQVLMSAMAPTEEDEPVGKDSAADGQMETATESASAPSTAQRLQ